MQSKTVAKTVGKIGNRALVDFLFLCQEPYDSIDPQATISLGKNYGIGVSFLCHLFLLELNFLPLLINTNEKFFDN